ncbi:hypothetical protein Asppvi_009454 [Aspergillus pseudoviridinutans]|uniref:Uncharacterized protein n=1 Tax=Aspergillus pseudoviridinutans TaxID=1517512 RepID=A0A9P3BHU0_9EURO|nr:uncharacterized protein Asppvi_009454 [Aspergillus pseudoviridinutans]GIJ90499.1 hypothetical protein Asppvi_009454 [Aspergillus pseudoviridinutans]
MDSVLQEWYRSAGFTDVQQQAIAEALQRFHTANGPTTKGIIDRIEVAITQTFIANDAMVQRWPSDILKLMNQFPRSAAPLAIEFGTWARSWDQEGRKQAISIWISLLAVLVFNWKSYGADGALESMGLNLSWTLKDDIDAIRYYALSGQSLKVLGKMANKFFTEVLHDQPRLATILQNMFSFSRKLGAIDHYARVLVLEDAFYHWIETPGNISPAEKKKLQDSLNEVSISWIDQDAERPPVDPLAMVRSHHQMASPEWRAYTEYIEPIIAEWLTGQSTGPMSTVILFLYGKLNTPSYRKVYKVKMQIEEDFSVDPIMAARHPTAVDTKATIEQANKEARRCIREELGPKKAALEWDECMTQAT